MKHYIIILFSLSLFACELSLGEKGMPSTSAFFKTQLPLMMAKAIEREDISKIRELANSIDVNHTFERGMTFLMWSIAQEKFVSTEVLLSLGADSSKPVEGSYPLKLASMYDDIRLLKLLIQHKADINQKVNGVPVWFATFYADNWQHMNLFLANGVNINAANNVGETAIMELATMDEYAHVLKLIKHGADITAGLNTINSFAYIVQTSIPHKNSPEFKNREKVVKLLERKGIFFPVKSPSEIRAEREKAGS